MRNITYESFDINTNDWTEITRLLKRYAKSMVTKPDNHIRGNFYIGIVTDIRYLSEGQTITTRLRDLHTTMSETLTNIRDLPQYCEDYIDMLQEFCENNNKGGIGSAGDFQSVEMFQIVILKPIGN